ncbi:MAG: ribonuclease III [Ruminococcaceae bacterium]|nr:ribonuclease III [Oscillospiraceae bacterium]
MNLLEAKIGYEFKDKALLQRALTHSSYANEHHHEKQDNERLEFLGDSVLGFITAEYLFKNHKDLPEGELTKLRAYAVCEKSLFGFAKEIRLGDFIELSNGEVKTGGRERPSVLSDAFEALIAAIYIDAGIDRAREFVLEFIEPCLNEKPNFKDYKTTLQEVIQKNHGDVLSYVLVEESGPDHDKCFKVEAHLNSNVIGTGIAGSKKKAEQEAARQALELMGL